MFLLRTGGAHLRRAPQEARARADIPAVVAMSIVFGAVMFGVTSPAEALPSFARQTGQLCGTCHTDYPGLTPYGRLFKMNGYTTAGGGSVPTLFPSQDNPVNALAAYAKKTGAGKDPNSPTIGQSDTSNVWVPPIAVMAVFGYTHTQAAQDPDAIAPYNPNDK